MANFSEDKDEAELDRERDLEAARSSIKLGDKVTTRTGVVGKVVHLSSANAERRAFVKLDATGRKAAVAVESLRRVR